ncbi:MAG: porin [Vicingaceae bacterium]|nr:porin [Vicingaceae bacterium]
MSINLRLFFLGCLVGLSLNLVAQNDSIVKVQPSNGVNEEVKKQWFEKISIRGYAQVRYNGLAETNPDLKCEQCDGTWGGDKNAFSMRRIRLVFFGQISNQVYFYIQPDFASTVGGSMHTGQLRDAYIDLGLDKSNVFRFRLGQSKIPYGFENMQSSSNRLPLDRHDALNSAIKNERDLGVFFYWTPELVQERMRYISKNGLKHSGNYGMFSLGVYNGQTANNPELNNQKHIVSRFSYPFQIGKQIIEPGIQAYTGKYVLSASKITPGVKVNNSLTYIDERAAASFVLYPQPFGIQAEYNVGRGPEYNKKTDSIEVQDLQGGYITLSYKKHIKSQIFIPFVRGHYYDGGKKHERDARSYTVRELEFGIEWQPNKNFELVVMYVGSDRRFEDAINIENRQKGTLFRFQAQVNF